MKGRNDVVIAQLVIQFRIYEKVSSQIQIIFARLSGVVSFVYYVWIFGSNQIAASTESFQEIESSIGWVYCITHAFGL